MIDNFLFLLFQYSVVVIVEKMLAQSRIEFLFVKVSVQEVFGLKHKPIFMRSILVNRGASVKA